MGLWARQGEEYRRLLEPKKDDVVCLLVSFLKRFDISTAYPLLLHLFDAGLSDDDWRTVSRILESYLLRRAVCGLTNKNYNRIFLALTRTLRREETTPKSILKYFITLTGDSSVWPRNDAFLTAWQTQNAYHSLQNSQIVHILRRLNDTYLTNLNEEINIENPLTVEHILPQAWQEHWPLPDGSIGLSNEELWTRDPDDARAKESTARNASLHTFGNLTILTLPLNSSVSNSAWEVKKPALLNASLLPINQQLHRHSRWDEAAIEERSKELYARALLIWPGPEVAKTDAATDHSFESESVQRATPK